MTSPLYAKHGSPEFNARLDAALHSIAGEVNGCMGEKLIALILGGGYGRGEGGLVEVEGLEMPYNDLDLIMVVQNRLQVPEKELREISRKYETELGIHVDFSRPLTVADIRAWPSWLMWFDLLNGHHVLSGPPDILLKNAPDRLREQLPPIEASRLLLNRGAGLLWALRVIRGREPVPDADFLRRNFFKCALSLGDALLIVHGRYTSTYSGRDGRLAALAASLEPVAALNLEHLYRTALQFKFLPNKVDAGAPGEQELHSLAQLWGRVLLHVERIRTGINWQSPGEYVNWTGIREIDQHGWRRLPRNFVRNLQGTRLSTRYPREYMYRELPVLLGLTGAAVGNWARRSARFLRWWRKFN